jgi:peroxiredoxin
MRILAALLVCCALSVCRAQESPGPALPDLTGVLRHPLNAGAQTGSVLIFYWHDCPICNSYAAEIKRICAHYTNFNFYIVQVDSDLTVEAARTHAREYALQAPVLLDGRHVLARLAGATVTPEAVVFGKDKQILYRGRIDNLYADLVRRRTEATEHNLRDALDAIAAGKRVINQPQPLGCLIP